MQRRYPLQTDRNPSPLRVRGVAVDQWNDGATNAIGIADRFVDSPVAVPSWPTIATRVEDSSSQAAAIIVRRAVPEPDVVVQPRPYVVATQQESVPTPTFVYLASRQEPPAPAVPPSGYRFVPQVQTDEPVRTAIVVANRSQAAAGPPTVSKAFRAVDEPKPEPRAIVAGQRPFPFVPAMPTSRVFSVPQQDDPARTPIIVRSIGVDLTPPRSVLVVAPADVGPAHTSAIVVRTRWAYDGPAGVVVRDAWLHAVGATNGYLPRDIDGWYGETMANGGTYGLTTLWLGKSSE